MNSSMPLQDSDTADNRQPFPHQERGMDLGVAEKEAEDHLFATKTLLRTRSGSQGLKNGATTDRARTMEILDREFALRVQEKDLDKRRYAKYVSDAQKIMRQEANELAVSGQRITANIPKGKEPVTPPYHVLESTDVPKTHTVLVVLSDDDEEEEEMANKLASNTNNSSVNIVDPRAAATMAIVAAPSAATSAPPPHTPASGAPTALAPDSAAPATYGHGNGVAGACARGIKRPHPPDAIFAPSPDAVAPMAFATALATPAAYDHGNMRRMEEELQDKEVVSASLARTMHHSSMSAWLDRPGWPNYTKRPRKPRSAPRHRGLRMNHNTAGPAPAYAGSSSRAPPANISNSAPGSSSRAPPADICNSIPGSSSRLPPANISSSAPGSSSSATPSNVSSSAPGSSSSATPANVSSSAPGLATAEQGRGMRGFIRIFGVEMAPQE
ncbi:mucin-1-like [Hordeum vulgare subsp. vulgare]|nr:mucin-1-like [Hordeum vulgare subsp. vulgare]